MQRYRERLWASPSIFLLTALIIPASLLVFLPISPAVGVVAAVVLYGVSVLILIVTSPVISVSDSEFRAGRAVIPLEYLGTPTGFRGHEAFLERGQRLDARAWLMIRGWVGPVIKVPLLDVDDPTPYWLISTRHPERVIGALDRATR